MTLRSIFLISSLLLISARSIENLISKELAQTADSTSKQLSSWIKWNKMDLEGWTNQKKYSTAIILTVLKGSTAWST